MKRDAIQSPAQSPFKGKGIVAGPTFASPRPLHSLSQNIQIRVRMPSVRPLIHSRNATETATGPDEDQPVDAKTIIGIVLALRESLRYIPEEFA